MVRQGEPTRKFDMGVVRDGGKEDPRQLFDDFLAKFDKLATAGKIHSSEDKKPYPPARLAQMRADIEQVRDLVFSLQPESARGFKVMLINDQFENRMFANAARCVSESADREEWIKLLIKALELLHPGI